MLESIDVFYARVSPTLEDKGTIETQLHTWQTYSRAHGITAEVVVDDGVSGFDEFKHRPGGARVLHLASRGLVKRLFIWRYQRFGRNNADTVTTSRILIGAGVKIISITEPFDSDTPMGRWMMDQLGSMAELDRENIRENTHQGRLRRVSENKWPAGSPPYGYKPVPAPDGRGTVLEVLETEAQFVRRAFALRAEGKSIEAIANELNALGSVPKRSRWGTTQVHRMFQNTTYQGVYQFGKARAKISGKCPAIVSPNQFREAQLTGERRGGHNKTREYALTGFLYCGRCGHRMSGTTSSTRLKGVRYYKPTYRCHKNMNGCGFSQTAIPLERKAWESLITFLTSADDLIKWADAILIPPPPDPEFVDLAKRKKALERQKERLLEQYVRGDYDDDLIKYDKLMDETKSQLAVLKRLESASEAGSERKTEDVLKAVADAKRMALGLRQTPEEKQPEFIRLFLDRCVVNSEPAFQWSLDGLLPG
jgi:site-specific DNA recombinase